MGKYLELYSAHGLFHNERQQLGKERSHSLFSGLSLFEYQFVIWGKYYLLRNSFGVNNKRSWRREIGNMKFKRLGSSDEIF